MSTPAASVRAYILAKDGNRPHLLDAAIAPDVELRTVVDTDAISFPPALSGREAFAETLVRRFNQDYENIYTFCLASPPEDAALTFSCPWLVAMSVKQSRGVRVGVGRYRWTFRQPAGLVTGLAIHIDAMEVLPPDALAATMAWASGLPYPWCPPAQALASAPAVDGLERVLRALRGSG